MSSDLIKNRIVAQLGGTFDIFLFFDLQLIILQEMHNQARRFSIYLLLPAPVSSTNHKWNVNGLPEDAVLTSIILNFFPPPPISQASLTLGISPTMTQPIIWA